MVSASLVKNFIDYFAVSKGDDDIRVVFNGTSCEFNVATLSSKSGHPLLLPWHTSFLLSSSRYGCRRDSFEIYFV